MEVLKENLVEQELVAVDNVQIKLEHKVALPENAKKLIGVSCQLLGQNTQVNGAEITLTGNLVTRLIFINEFEKFDSQDVTDTFEKKVTIKDAGEGSQVFATMSVLDSKWQLQDQQVVIDNLVVVNVEKVKTNDWQVVSDLTGDVEVRKNEHQILTFNAKLAEKFELEENIELEANCEGVLGVDANPNLKDVATSTGKVNLKGTIMVNMLGVKSVDNTSVPYNSIHEIDFSKSLTATGVTAEDLACGNVVVDAVEMHIENGQKGPVLVLKLTLIFQACVYGNHKFNSVVDAISFDKELSFQTAQSNYVEVLPQVNTTVEIESNVNLAPNTPYIAHVLAVDGVRVNNLTVNVGDGKTMLEGVLAMNLLLENEEHIVTGEGYEVPFQTHVRMDNLERDYTVNASVVPLNVNAKARRGTEILIDAQLGVVINASTTKQVTLMNNLEEGAPKVDDGSAISIYISCASLLQQNPNLENGCTPGERIVVYRHENVEL